MPPVVILERNVYGTRTSAKNINNYAFTYDDGLRWIFGESLNRNRCLSLERNENNNRVTGNKGFSRVRRTRFKHTHTKHTYHLNGQCFSGVTQVRDTMVYTPPTKTVILWMSSVNDIREGVLRCTRDKKKKKRAAQLRKQSPYTAPIVLTFITNHYRPWLGQRYFNVWTKYYFLFYRKYNLYYLNVYNSTELPNLTSPQPLNLTLLILNL